MRRIVAAALTLATALGLGTLAAPAVADETALVSITIKQIDGEPANSSCTYAQNVSTGESFPLGCDRSGGVYEGRLPLGLYRFFVREDLSHYNHQWQWYGGSASSTALAADAKILAITAGGLDLTWKLSENLVAFSDVQPGHPFFREITDLAASGVIGGYTDGTFRAGTPVSRQAFAAFLARVGGAAIGGASDAPSMGFSDVPPGHPFEAQINSLAYVKVIGGYEDNTFRPESPVSRQAAAAFFARLAHTRYSTFVAPSEPTFTDVAPGTQFFAHIEWTVREKVVNGYDDGTYRPAAPITRQAAAAMIYRYAKFGGPCCTIDPSVGAITGLQFDER